MTSYLTDNLKHYDVIQTISTGYLTTCYEVIHKSTGSHLILQAIDYGFLDAKTKEIFESEVKLLINQKHPNILNWLKCMNHVTTCTMYIIMEHCPGDSLQSLILKCRSSNTFISEGIIWNVLYKVARALHGLQSRLPNSLFRCDVKGENIFLDPHGDIKLGGFQLNDASIKNTRYWEESHNIKKTATHSLGELIYTLVFLTVPSSAKHQNMYEVLPAHYSEDLQRMINFMLDCDCEQSPSLEAVLYHPLVVSHVALTSLHNLHIDEEQERGENPASGRSSAISSEGKTCQRCKDFETKLELVRQREAVAKCKEQSLKQRELDLMKRERQISVMERLSKEKAKRAEVYLSQSRKRTTRPESDNLNESSYSADPGDTSVLPTTSKLDPDKIMKPTFLRNTFHRKTVHFHTLESMPDENTFYPLQPKPWVGNKRLSYISSSSGKENKKVSSIRGSLLSLKVRTKELPNGLIESEVL